MNETAGRAASVVLVGGHESADGADLRCLQNRLPSAVVSAAGRPLNNTVARLLVGSPDAVVVVPVSLGRDPSFVADTAKTLRWIARDKADRVALADTFGTPDHLAAWLRTAAIAVRTSAPDAAVVITADAANPFDDAELFRIAHLVRTHGAGNEIEVGIDDGDGALAATIDRLHRLGFSEVVIVPAGFQQHPRGALPTVSGVTVRFYGALVSEDAAIRVIHQRVSDALHSLGHGDNGIEAGLMADHGHGYAHSHAFDAASSGRDQHSHGHGHEHPHEHPHHHHDLHDDSHDPAHDRASYAEGTHNAR